MIRESREEMHWRIWEGISARLEYFGNLTREEERMDSSGEIVWRMVVV